MLRSEKERIVAELTKRLRDAKALILADYRGLSMTEIDGLRGQLLQSGARFSVVKNTLTRRAAEEAGVEQLLELLDGPTAIAFLEPEGDPVAVAKVLNEAARTTRVLVVKGGIFEGKVISEGDVKSLAALPSLDVLRGQVLAAVIGPLNALAGLVAAPLRDFASLVDARIEQLEQQGGQEETAQTTDPVEVAQTTETAEEEE
jgi:large subunit ribosomal protein L10